MGVISTSDELSTPALCFNISFQAATVDQDFSANNSLPLNVTAAEGSNATFKCELGIAKPNYLSATFGFHYKLASQKEPVWNRSCNIDMLSARTCWVSDDGDYVTSLEIGLEEKAFKYFTFVFQVLNIDLKHNNSAFSCSISSGDQLQWLHSAYLNVTLATQATETYQYDVRTLISAVVVVMMVVIAAMIVTGSGMLLRRKWRRRYSGVFTSDQGM